MVEELSRRVSLAQEGNEIILLRVARFAVSKMANYANGLRFRGGGRRGGSRL